MSAAHQGWTIFGAPVHGRSCGSCKACCTWLPVHLPTAYKPANVRCTHLRSKGCNIYDRRPETCRAWSCRWLFDPCLGDVRRPDIAGFAVDPLLDTLIVDGEPRAAVQVWLDPDRLDAHRDPALRAWLERVRLPAIVRWGALEGLVIVPPALVREGVWLEHRAPFSRDVGNFSQLPWQERAAMAAGGDVP
jgi:hypothetical protein